MTVRPGEEVQLLCRDALEIGDQARTRTAGGTMTIDLGRIHPLRRALIPVTPLMGIVGNAPLRKGMCRSFPPSVSGGVGGGVGGNTDVRQLVKGSRLQLPVYVEGAKFSAGDGHTAQGDGEITGAAIETLMAATLRFNVIKNSVITSPRAIVPGARRRHDRPP